MTKFHAGTAVEKLEYDFTDYDGGAGFIPEPTTKKVNQYFNEVKAIAKDAKGLKAQAESLESLEEMSDDEAMEAIGNVDEIQAQADGFQTRMMEALVVLCGGEWVDNPADSEGKSDGFKHVEGGSPSLPELEALPYRVLQAFNQWLMDEIRPKRTTPGMKR